MAALAIGVVYHHVECGERHELGQTRIGQGEVMLLGVVLDVELQRPTAYGSVVAEHRGRDDAPSRSLAHREGRDLARGQSPPREIPQRPLATSRLIDRERVA